MPSGTSLWAESSLSVRAILIAAGSETPESIENNLTALAERKKAREGLDKTGVRAGMIRQKIP